MTVNELVRRAGLPPHVVRYYTQCGLLSPVRNSRNAYREYDACPGHGDLERCPIVAALSGEDQR